MPENFGAAKITKTTDLDMLWQRSFGGAKEMKFSQQ